MSAVTIPVMAKVRIGHLVEAQILGDLEWLDLINESDGMCMSSRWPHLPCMECYSHPGRGKWNAVCSRQLAIFEGSSHHLCSHSWKLVCTNTHVLERFVTIQGGDFLWHYDKKKNLLLRTEDGRFVDPPFWYNKSVELFAGGSLSESQTKHTLMATWTTHQAPPSLPFSLPPSLPPFLTTGPDHHLQEIWPIGTQYLAGVNLYYTSNCFVNSGEYFTHTLH